MAFNYALGGLFGQVMIIDSPQTRKGTLRVAVTAGSIQAVLC